MAVFQSKAGDDNSFCLVEPLPDIGPANEAVKQVGSRRIEVSHFLPFLSSYSYRNPTRDIKEWGRLLGVCFFWRGPAALFKTSGVGRFLFRSKREISLIFQKRIELLENYFFLERVDQRKPGSASVFPDHIHRPESELFFWRI